MRQQNLQPGKKFSDRGVAGVFVGYDRLHNGYRVLVPAWRKVRVSESVKFIESKVGYRELVSHSSPSSISLPSGPARTGDHVDLVEDAKDLHQLSESESESESSGDEEKRIEVMDDPLPPIDDVDVDLDHNDQPPPPAPKKRTAMESFQGVFGINRQPRLCFCYSFDFKCH